MSVESVPKRARRAVPPSWLNLARFGLYRDVRKLIYKKLDAFDRALVEEAHMRNRKVKLDVYFAAECAIVAIWVCCSGEHECPWSDVLQGR